MIRARWIGAAAVIAGLWGVVAFACDTPVYQYALLNWEPDYYQALYFYRGSEDPRDAEANRVLESASGGSSYANLLFDRVNVSDKSSLGPAGFRRAVWEHYSSQHKPPFHVILGPKGQEVFVGRLDAASVKGITSSPKRRQMAEQLCQGKKGILLLLEGTSQAQNEAAKGAVRAVVAEAQKQGADVGSITVGRGEAAEKWLVRQLLAVESDLKEFNDPMVFGVFGRGHVLEPFVGKGITKDNLAALVSFMNGPCSCEIKELNPGTYLMIEWNWVEKIGEWAFAEPQGPETGLFYMEFEEPPASTPSQPEKLAVDEPTPSRSAPTSTPAKGSTPSGRKATPRAEKPSSQTPEPKGTGETSRSAAAGSPVSRAAGPGNQQGDAMAEEDEETRGRAPESTDLSPRRPAEARGPLLPTPLSAAAMEANAHDTSSFASAMSLKVGLGLALGIVIVVGTGFVLLKRSKES